MSKMIRIQSTKTITVTPGLHHKDVTNPDAHIPDRLKVSPLWPRAMVMIKEGVGLYPAQIAEWNTVKALEKSGILTLGNIVEDDSTNVESEKLVQNLKTIEKEETQKKVRRTRTLDDIASED